MNNEERPSVSGVYNLSCPCGSDIAINARSAERSATCPDCGQVLDFVVSFDPRTRKARVALVMTPKSFVPPGEKPATRKSKTIKTAAVKAPAAATPPPPPKPSRPGYAAALCDCGNPVEIRIEEMAGDRTCSKCGAPHRIVVKVDKATGLATATLSPRSPFGARRSSASAPPAAAPTPAGRVSAPCACGATLTMEANDLAGEITCGRCRASYHAAAKSDRGGVKSLVLVPKTSPRAKTPPPPPPPPALDDAVFELTASSKVKTVQPPAPAKPERSTKRSTTRAPLPPGAQKVNCPCGHEFIVRRRDLGVETPCPGCGKTLVFREARDPQSLAPVITATVVR